MKRNWLHFRVIFHKETGWVFRFCLTILGDSAEQIVHTGLKRNVCDALNPASIWSTLTSLLFSSHTCFDSDGADFMPSAVLSYLHVQDD